MNEIANLISELRIRNREYRSQIEMRTIQGTIQSRFCTNVVEIACSLAELAILENRTISGEERYWFGGGYTFSFEFSGGDYQVILDLYTELIWKLKEFNIL